METLFFKKIVMVLAVTSFTSCATRPEGDVEFLANIPEAERCYEKLRDVTAASRFLTRYEEIDAAIIFVSVPEFRSDYVIQRMEKTDGKVQGEYVYRHFSGEVEGDISNPYFPNVDAILSVAVSNADELPLIHDRNCYYLQVLGNGWSKTYLFDTAFLNSSSTKFSQEINYLQKQGLDILRLARLKIGLMKN